MSLTICFTTCRKDPKFDWFAASLASQLTGPPDFKLLVIDFWSQVMPGWTEADVGDRLNRLFHQSGDLSHVLDVVPPKPTVWQGPHRLTKEDFFAQANCRNTAICLADDGYLAFVDDLSVPLPGWLAALRESAVANRVVCGAYQKVKDLVVEDGQVVSFTAYPEGEDSRKGFADRPTPCPGDRFYGCSCGAPLEAFLQTGGYSEICDGTGYEDSAQGRMMKNNGWPVVYDRRMKTLESDELHHAGPQFRRDDPGVSPNDKSHAMRSILDRAKSHPGFFGDEGIRGLRDRVRRGEKFPVMHHPTSEWFTGKPLCEL